jgi:hypothetical protein
MSSNFHPDPKKQQLVYMPNIDYILTRQGIGTRSFDGMVVRDFKKTIFKGESVDIVYDTSNKGGVNRRSKTFVNMKKSSKRDMNHNKNNEMYRNI